jgi:hypothetical protein
MAPRRASIIAEVERRGVAEAVLEVESWWAPEAGG